MQIQPPKARKIIAIMIAASVILGIAACIPVENETVNTELFKDADELRALANKLTSGMRKEEVLEIIKIPIEKFTFMSTEELQKAVYGNSEVQGTPEQLERFKNKLLRYQGYYLPYINLSSKGSIGFGKMKINKKGQNLRFILLFEDDRLLRAAVDGARDIDQNQDQYMWNSLIQKGAGLAF